MNIGAPLTERRLRTSLAFSLLLHVAVVLYILIGPGMGDLFVRDDAPEVMMVRLRGGGENIPGWIKPTTAPPDDAPVPDNKPQPVPTPKKDAVEETKPATPEPAMEEPTRTQEEPEVQPQDPSGTEAVQEAETQPASDEGEVADEAAGDAGSAQPVEGETGEGVGAKPGPEGPGFGAYSDADFPGADTFLSRVEAEVQRRFNFRGRGTGAIAEYHFYIQRNGQMADLLLMSSSGINSLDMAARSALIRAKFPPLPPGFRADKLGVTYRFHDAK